MENTLSKHGRLDCRRCFNACDRDSMRLGKWKIQNDPCYWGSGTPEILVLGFSKGFTQSKAFEVEPFQNIPFKGMRNRLTDALRVLGVADNKEDVDQLVSNPNSRIGFASLIRCSVARVDEKASMKAGTDVFSCTGPIIKKSFKEIPTIIATCTEKHLRSLPGSIKIVILLGVDSQYVRMSQTVISGMFRDSQKIINEVAMLADDRLWVWASHPSGLNGHFNSWINGIRSSGLKMRMARDAISRFIQTPKN